MSPPPEPTPTVGGAEGAAGLLGPATIRDLAARLGLRPTKHWGQNFVVDANTVRRIVRLAALRPDDVVVEVGPGLGSLTLALAPAVRRVVAVEVDPVLAAQLPATLATHAPGLAGRVEVVARDALTVPTLPGPPPTALVANLPYNVSVPVLLRFLAAYDSLRRVLVMVQLEVAERLCAAPGSRVYGVPSVKAAWYGRARLLGTVPRTVFWPAPRVDSGLVALDRGDPPTRDVPRDAVFGVVDAAFAQRRKTLRVALAPLFGSPAAAQAALAEAGVDPASRGEQLDVAGFAAVAARLPTAPDRPRPSSAPPGPTRPGPARRTAAQGGPADRRGRDTRGGSVGNGTGRLGWGYDPRDPTRRRGDRAGPGEDQP